ncbi:MAG: hypothetical protein JXO72_07160 [Vicinamibacteria bacterium]|nr:hypothetical protein [Vicinamibacteria bacterium]
MTRCERFEQEGLLLLEQGRRLGEHFEICADCRTARIEYEKLQARIGALGRDEAPPAGWEARVRAALERRKAREWWPQPRFVLAAAAVALVSAAIFFAPRLEPPPPSLAVETQAGHGQTRRGAEVHPDDFLTLTARTGGARHAELRVYLNDAEVVLRCSTEPPCARDGDRLEATLRLHAMGLYQPVLLLSDAAPPIPESGLDADLHDAVNAGARLVMGDEVDVR